jgi:uncharacterized membrane protein YfcA
MDWLRLAEGFLAALVIATATSPVGVSGAVFLLPVQLDLLHVPNPSVTPTNLMFNVVATPGALLRYRRQLAGPLTSLLLIGTLPGVVCGAILRVYVVPGPTVFRLVAAAVLMPIGCWLVSRSSRAPTQHPHFSSRRIVQLALLVGLIGGVYGIGGGSILGPILVGSGMAVSTVAPAALASTFITSIIGAVTYTALAATTSGSIAPEWSVGVACGIGGLIGGYAGARLQPRIAERALRLLLGLVAAAVGAAYLIDVIT